MKTLSGKVILCQMAKTVVVEVERLHLHPLYKKLMRKTKKFKAHNENFSLKVGDEVKICQTRPISREKHFKVVEVLK